MGSGGGSIQRVDANEARGASAGPSGSGGGGLGCLRLYYEQSTSVLKNIG